MIRAQDINFPEDYFDLVLCVTVLQHIINPDDLSKAVKNIVRTGKWLLILETSPPTPLVVSSSYMVFKTRKEWIDLFRSNDCDLIYELPLPQEGSRFVSLMSHFLNLRNQKDKNKKRTPASMTKANEISKGQRMILNILRLTDYLFLHIPYPKGRTLYRILVFKKS